MNTPEKYFLKKWKVTDGGRTDVESGQLLKIHKDGGELQLAFPEGLESFGDGQWDQYDELLYVPEKGILTCRFQEHRVPVTAEFFKCSTHGLRCVITRDKPDRDGQEPGEWTAEEEGGSLAYG